MKIIGHASKDSHYDPVYICTVNRRELEKFFNMYYSSTNAKLPEYKVGDEIDLGRGHDFAGQIASALKKTQEFVEANQTVVTAILNGLNFQRICEAAANTEADTKAAP